MSYFGYVWLLLEAFIIKGTWITNALGIRDRTETYYKMRKSGDVSKVIFESMFYDQVQFLNLRIHHCAVVTQKHFIIAK